MKKYIIAFILLSILSVSIGYGMAKYKKSSAVIEVLPSTETIKSYSNTNNLSYNELSRSPEQYKGKKITVKGTVLQVLENGNNVSLRIAVNGNSDKAMLATYKTGNDYKRILENDVVTILGVSNGLYTYESTLNTEITVPSIAVDYIVLGNK